MKTAFLPAFAPFSSPEAAIHLASAMDRDSGRLQSVLVTDWSDANTIKIDKPEKKLHHEAWRKGTNKANFCGNVRLPYSQGKYYEEKPSVRFTW